MKERARAAAATLTRNIASLPAAALMTAACAGVAASSAYQQVQAIQGDTPSALIVELSLAVLLVAAAQFLLRNRLRLRSSSTEAATSQPAQPSAIPAFLFGGMGLAIASITFPAWLDLWSTPSTPMLEAASFLLTTAGATCGIVVYRAATGIAGPWAIGLAAAAGCLATGLYGGPVWGLESWTTMSSILLALLCWRLGTSPAAARRLASSFDVLGRPSEPTSATILGFDATTSDALESSRWIDVRDRFASLMIALLCGIAVPWLSRWLHQLTPHTPQLDDALWAGLFLGIAGGGVLARRFASVPAWVQLVSASFGLAVLAAWQSVTSSASVWFMLQIASRPISADVALALRMLLVAMSMGLLISFGAWAAFTARGASVRGASARSSGPLVALGVGFIGVMISPGLAPGGALASLSRLSLLAALLGWTYAVAGWRNRRGLLKPLPWGAFLMLLICGTLPVASMLRPNGLNEAYAGRLLCSTPVLVAARNGASLQELRSIDGSRLIDVIPGRHRSFAIWRHRGGEIYVRENGIPRGPMSCDSDIFPSATSESLLGALPLAFAGMPRHAAVLGVSSGTLVQTVLAFPVPHISLVDGDGDRLTVLSQLTNGLPLLDDPRISQSVGAPARWLKESTEPLDVVIADPPGMMLAESRSWFTRSFYRAAARRLSEGGVFAQRVCVLDVGPHVVRQLLATVQSEFHETAMFFTGPGELTLLATNREEGLMTRGFIERLDSPQMLATFAQLGWDWSVLTDLPAYRHQALVEFQDDAPTPLNTAASMRLPYRAAREMLVWDAKLQPLVQELSRPLRSPADSTTGEVSDDPDDAAVVHIGEETSESRQSRVLDWAKQARGRAVALRHLKDVQDQVRLTSQNPDVYGWEYRKLLKKRLKDSPDPTIQQVSAWGSAVGPTDLERSTSHRTEYLEALGRAIKSSNHDDASRRLRDLEEFWRPYDALVSPFLPFEAAEIAKTHGVVDAELRNRLRLVYYAPPRDASVRYVADALDCVARSDSSLSAADGWDHANGLLEVLRQRWEARSTEKPKSNRRALRDVEYCLKSTDRAMTRLAAMHMEAGIDAATWTARERVLERQLVRPLRSLRDELQAAVRISEAKTRMVMQQANESEPTIRPGPSSNEAN